MSAPIRITAPSLDGGTLFDLSQGGVNNDPTGLRLYGSTTPIGAIRLGAVPGFDEAAEFWLQRLWIESAVLDGTAALRYPSGQDIEFLDAADLLFPDNGPWSNVLVPAQSVIILDQVIAGPVQIDLEFWPVSPDDWYAIQCCHRFSPREPIITTALPSPPIP